MPRPASGRGPLQMYSYQVRVITALALFLFSLAGCKPRENELYFETIEQEDGGRWGFYEGNTPKLLVMTEPEEISELYSLVSHPGAVENVDTGETWDYPEWRLQDFDWGDYFVVIAFRGVKGTTGYEVTIQRITQRGSRIAIYADFAERGEVETDVVTSPLHVVEVEKTASVMGKTLQFDLVVDGKTVAGTQHDMPKKRISHNQKGTIR